MYKMELYEDIYQQKFSFGKNRESFLKKLDEHKIENAKNYLKNFIKGEISGKTVIDFGSGSGLMSLAFCLLGASKVISVDIDESSVNCGRYLRDKYKINKKQWKIMKGSVLDKNFVQSLGKFDIVYSWGVIHHTGNMWKGLENIKLLVKKGGLLYIAIYNEFHGFPSSIARKKIKKFYAGTNELIKKLMNILLILQTILMRIVRIKNPIKYIKNYGESSARGMDFYTDIKDWLGGYPYEYATWQKLEEYYGKDGFILENLFDSSAGIGCHELLFKKEV